MNERALYQAPEVKAPDALALTRMWGSTQLITIDRSAPVDGFAAQFSDIRLPEPVVCTIYFQAELDGNPGTIAALTVELLLGLGRTNVKRVTTFASQPTFGAPLIWTLPNVPLAVVQARAIAQGVAAVDLAPMLVRCTLQVAPITRLHYQQEALKFGMAVPGEADGMDDAMLEDLEEHAPERAAVMRARQAEGRHPMDEDGDEDEDEDEDGPGQIVVPPNMQRVVDRISARLGRPATVRDLPPALRRRLLRQVSR